MKITKQQLYEIIIEETIKEVQQQNKPEPLNDGLIPKALKLPKAAMVFIEKSSDLYWALRDLKFSPSFRPTGWRTTPPIGKVGNKIKEIIDDFESNFLRSFEEALEWKLWRSIDAKTATSAFKTAATDLANVAELTADLQKALKKKLESFKGLPKTTANVADFTRFKTDYKIVSDFKKKLGRFDVFTTADEWTEGAMMNALHYLSKGKEPGFWKQIWHSDRAFKTVAAKRNPKPKVDADGNVVKPAKPDNTTGGGVGDKVGKYGRKGLKKWSWPGLSNWGLALMSYPVWSRVLAKMVPKESLPSQLQQWSWLFPFLDQLFKVGSLPTSFVEYIVVPHIQASFYKEQMANSAKAKKFLKTSEGKAAFRQKAQNWVILRLASNNTQAGGVLQGHYLQLFNDKTSFYSKKGEIGDGIKIAYNEDPGTKQIIDDILKNLFANVKADNVKEIFNKEDYMNLYISQWRAWAKHPNRTAPIDFVHPFVTHNEDWSSTVDAMCDEMHARSNQKTMDTWSRGVGLFGKTAPPLFHGSLVSKKDPKTGKETSPWVQFCDKSDLLKYERMYVAVTNVLDLNQQNIIKELKTATLETRERVKSELEKGKHDKSWWQDVFDK